MLLQELKVGSKTLGNMLSSGRFAVVAVEDVRASLRSPHISAPAALPNAAPPSPGQPPPPSPAEQFPSSRTWPPDGGRSPRPDEPASPPPATAAGSEDPSPQAATRDEAPHGSGEQRDAFAEPAAKLAPATPEQESPDPYPVEAKATALAVAERMKAVGMTEKDWYFAFQSQGIAGAPWISPTVPDTLKALADAGHKAVVLQPVGFLCDHVEILYDIDIDFKQQAADLGMRLTRAESLNDSPTLIRAIDHVLYGAQALSSIPEEEFALAR